MDSLKTRIYKLVLVAGVSLGSLLPSASLAAPAPYPLTVSSQDQRAPSLNTFQAEPRTFRVTFLDGTNVSDVSAATVFMGWATNAYANTFVTSTWSKVDGGSNGVVDFTFSAADLNTNGSLIYFVGAGSTYRQGALTIAPNPWSTGVSAPTTTSNINMDLYTWTGGPFIRSVDASNSFALAADVAATNAGLQSQISGLEAGSPIDSRPATNTVNMGSNAINNVSSLQFAGGTGNQATMSWNADDETLDLIQNGATLQLGQESHWHVRADGLNITNGQVVYASGTVGNSGRIKVKPYLANGSIPAHLILGIATEDIDDGTDGKVTDFGKVRGIPVPFAEDSVLYPSPTVAGGLTTTKPTGTNVSTEIAFVVTSNAANGTIAVRVHPHDANETLTRIANAQADASNQFVNVAGDTMTGVLEVNDISAAGQGGTEIDLQSRAFAGRWTFESGLIVNDSVGSLSGQPIVFTSPLTIADINTNAVVFITATGGLQVGQNSFKAFPSGDISQDATNTATLGAVSATSISGDGSGLTNLAAANLAAGGVLPALDGSALTGSVNAATLQSYTAQQVADLERSTANFDFTTLSWSPTVSVSRADGVFQRIITQGPTWIQVPAGLTNMGYMINLEIGATTNSITFLPDNILIATNLYTYTNRTMSFLLHNAWDEDTVGVYGLKRDNN